MLGTDGGGTDIMLGTVLPVFQVLSASCSVGLMEAAIARTVAHATSARLEHLGTTLADNPVTRAHIARMRVATDGVRGLLVDTLDAMTDGRADASLRVLETKVIAGDTAATVLDTAMRVCGGAAFRKETGVERYFRDARAAAVMAPTSDTLYDFIGRSLCGLPLL
jgi:alkylation response protein AidB-like acyl-CoA dehydrogenase